MKTIIAGSRKIPSMGLNEPQDWFKPGVQDAMLDLLEEIIKKSKFDITEIISGTAWGIDSLGELYGEKNQIPIKKIPANWKEHGRKAGHMRNMEMAKLGDALIVVMAENSSGSENMLSCMKSQKKPYFAIILGSKPTEKWY